MDLFLTHILFSTHSRFHPISSPTYSVNTPPSLPSLPSLISPIFLLFPQSNPPNNHSTPPASPAPIATPDSSNTAQHSFTTSLPHFPVLSHVLASYFHTPNIQHLLGYMYRSGQN
ncbi:uncharacterized protein K444DRAFT_609856 [Hyaloscypha bicolor E]|uniref:Uncharacterized protein n=1 Tax=Hyaloscypha bicolor E TaxID=1095630 RepID=A0A2J6TKX6_9HELO|nr:uncharacterized protein K444DRAFT_609856 [Hyaloscypha bicolor E]PMD63671.1 hypothetical protein K444DRAFT_609856 [Hyaloscypha bicolor E]